MENPVGLIRDLFNTVYADGSSTNPTQPPKVGVRGIGATIDAQFASLIDGLVIGGAVVYATRSALYADLAHPAGRLGVVYNDSTPAYNGVYVKSGSSGSGSWAITGLAIPSSFGADLNAAILNITALTNAAPLGDTINLSSATGTGGTAYGGTVPAAQVFLGLAVGRRVQWVAATASSTIDSPVLTITINGTDYAFTIRNAIGGALAIGAIRSGRYYDAVITAMPVGATPGTIRLMDAATVNDLVDGGDTLRKISKPWLSAAAEALPSNATDQINALAAITDVVIINPDVNRDYRFVVIYNGHSTQADGMIIRDDLGNDWNRSGAAAGKADGQVMLTLNRSGSDTQFLVTVDYRLMSGGAIPSVPGGTAGINAPVNTSSTRFLLNKQIAAAESMADMLRFVRARAWLASSVAVLPALAKQAAAAIIDVRAYGLDRTKTYRITIMCKDDATFQDRLWIAASDASKTWTFNGTVPGKADGPVWVVASHADGSSLELLIDYRKITSTGIIQNAANDILRLSSTIHLDERTRAIAQTSSSSSSVLAPLARALRVSVSGSSISWGQGWLGQLSYVGEIEDFLRNVLARTKLPADMVFTGTNATISNPLFYKGAARSLEGINSEVSFTLDGDELSLCIARERGNVGAARVELYLDNVLHDTFSTYNSEPYGTGETFAFTGDGATRLFDLGRAFTYGHTLTVGGAAKVVAMNTQGIGASIPGGVDALVIRKLVTVSGKPEVHHFLWFAVAPSNGAAIAGTYDYGESITYVRNTVGQTARALTAANESAYGDGNVSFDPANPAAVSSGLNFRESDVRSVKSWHFDTATTRTVRLKIASLDPRGSGTAKLVINFATNRMHHIQNAGIGGWTAGRLLTDTGLNNIQQIIDFAPDVLLLESCTNDDWQVGVYRAWRARAGLSDATVRADSAAFMRALTFGGSTYSMDDVRIPIAAITATSLDLDMTDVTAVIVPGDVVTLGNFAAGDNRCVVSRVVKAWDAGTGRITWDKPLRASELVHVRALSDLVGGTAMVRGAPDWVDDLETIIDDVRAVDPSIEVSLATSGIPNWRYRRLEGYRELAMDVAGRKDCGFVDFYRRTRDWQFSQPRSTQRYIGSGLATAATGVASYPLYNSDGSPATDADGSLNLARHWSVLVDGVERINRGCYVSGGPKSGWASGVTPMTLSNTSVVSDRYTLVFTDNVPSAGAVIVVKHAANKWSTDDCHPGTSGMAIMGREALAFMHAAAVEAAAA